MGLGLLFFLVPRLYSGATVVLASWMRVWLRTRGKDKLLAANKRPRLLGWKLAVVRSGWDGATFFCFFFCVLRTRARLFCWRPSGVPSPPYHFSRFLAPFKELGPSFLLLHDGKSGSV